MSTFFFDLWNIPLLKYYFKIFPQKKKANICAAAEHQNQYKKSIYDCIADCYTKCFLFLIFLLMSVKIGNDCLYPPPV